MIAGGIHAGYVSAITDNLYFVVSCVVSCLYLVSRYNATLVGEDTFVFAQHVLYLDRIRWFPDVRTEIHSRYIRIQQDTGRYLISV